jgi:general secretion pathway protein D
MPWGRTGASLAAPSCYDLSNRSSSDGQVLLRYNSVMRLLTASLALFSLCAWGHTAPPANTTTACAQLRTVAACHVPAADLKQAEKDFRHGLELQKLGKTQSAFDSLEAAARRVPANLEYLTTKEILRQQLVLSHLNSGNQLLLANNTDRATVEFRQALALDPSNDFAQQRLKDALPPASGNLSSMTFADSPGELRTIPASGIHSYHYRGDTRGLFQQVARDFGLVVEFDDSVTARPIRFDVDDVDFSRAISLLSSITKTFWTPISEKRFLVLADNAQNRAQFERMSLRTFYVPDATSAQELNDVLNVMRTMFDIRQIVHQPESSSIIVRAPRRMLDAATQLLKSVDISRPQVMLDIRVLQVNLSMMKDLGIDFPLQWSAFNLTSAALAALTTPNLQDQINQLIASGGINQANSSSIAALLQQLQNQQNSLFKNPVGTFGGGNTRFAVPFAPTTVHFSMNSSRVTTVQTLTLRAQHGSDATLKIGDRYPIVNATFSPIFNTPAISQVLQNQTYQNPFPSFSFEDLGLTVKAKPQVHPNDIDLDLTIEMRALTGDSLNGVPVISSRTYAGSLSVTDGETAIIAGSVDRSETLSLTGPPGVSQIPILNRVTTHTTPQETEGELLVLITPRIVRRPVSATTMIPIRTVD